MRVDALRNIDALLEAAMTVFQRSGVDAPIRAVAEEAGVGVGTLYRHFPQRSDLIVAVVRHEVDACAAAAGQFLGEHRPGEALVRWLFHYAAFMTEKRGLATALHSGHPAYEALPAYFNDRLRPAIQLLLDAGAASGEVRAGIAADDLLGAVANLCRPIPGDATSPHRMINLLVDGLRP